MPLNTAEELVEDIRGGKMIIIMDDEDRENEGDFIIAAEHCNAETINFMTKHGRGLICLTLTEAHCQRLNLPLMVQDTRYTHRTNFTVSIEAATGVTTGISAADRARTVQAAVNPSAGPQDITQPGHIFPLMAQSGGVLTRAGHTEAGCDFAGAAGLAPAAVIVEILKDDGTMARRPDLEVIAEKFDLKIGTIADLIRFRIENEKTVVLASTSTMPTEFGDFLVHVYEDAIHGDVHIAMVKGKIDPEKPTLVRVHRHNPLADLNASISQNAARPLRDALKKVADQGEGVVVILFRQISNGELVKEIVQYGDTDSNKHLPESGSMDLRQLGLGAQILSDIGVRKMRLMSAQRKYHAISGFGLEVVEYVS